MTDTRPTDSEIAAQWSIQATQDGRYELAEAVLRIAMQAIRTEKAHPEAPARLRVVSHNGADGSNAFEAVATMNSAPAPLPTATAVIAMDRPAPTRDNRRCEASSLNDGNGFEIDCHTGVYWDHQAQVWKHIDAELDKDHYPVVRQG